jgi:hypothetical protein
LCQCSHSAVNSVAVLSDAVMMAGPPDERLVPAGCCLR